MEGVVRDVVDGPDDPAAVAVIEDVDAGRCLFEVAEVRAAAGEGVRDEDAVHAAVEDGERRFPIFREQAVERRQDAVECLAERLAAQEARLLIADLERAHEHLLELLGRNRVQTSAAPLVELGPRRSIGTGRDDRGRLERARQRARHDEVEAHVLERAMCSGRLLEAALGQPHHLRVALADVRDLCVPHEIEPPAHADSISVHTIAAMPTRAPLLVLDNVESFLDGHGLGSGPITATRIGDGGGSNFTFLLERGGERFVLRRPPRPPLPPSAHDMVREAGLQNAIRAAGFTRLADIVAVCDDESVLGVPFYVMRYLDGHVITQELPRGLGTEDARFALGMDLVDTLVEIHAARGPSLESFARPGSYLDRQVKRFGQLWEINQTREIAAVDEVARYLADHTPEPLEPTVVHGDYRLGNMMVAPDDPRRIVAVLDWEMGAIGDPRADVGYLLATYSEPDGQFSPLGSSPVTAEAGFPSRTQLVERYVERSGRDVEPLPWFEALALWKAAVFCEAIYGRFVRGELGEEDTRAAIFEHAVPLLAQTALEAVS